MATYGPIQVIPPGLLGFLQLKTGGLNPTELNGLLQPTLQLRDWMFLATAESLTNSQAGVGIGSAWAPLFGGGIVVPQGEAWWVEFFSGVALINAGGVMSDFRLGYRSQNIVGITDNVFILSPVQVAKSAGQYMNADGYRPFFMPPGAELMYFRELSGGTSDIRFNVRLTRLKL